MVLKTLVGEYIRTATPVSSEDVSLRSQLGVSSATIRNEMAELEEEGYIVRPHISAGGIPSDRGYRFYVESLQATPEPPAGLRRHVRDQFGRAEKDLEAWIQLGAMLLSKMAGNMAIVTFPRAASSRLKYIHLVYLQEFLALVIIVMQQTRLRQHLLPLNGPTSQGELDEVANRLNGELGGLTYAEITAKQVSLSPLEDMVRDDAAAILKDVDTEAALQHHVDGLRLLLNQPEFAETGRAQEIVEILEERVLLRSVLPEAPSRGEHGGADRGGEPGRGAQALQRRP